MTTPRSQLIRRAAVLLLALLALGARTTSVSTQTASGVPLPALFEKYLSDFVKLTPVEHRALLSGAPVSKLLAADPSKEVALFGAVWIDAPPNAYLDRVKDIENFERGGAFRVTKRISSPPRLADFDQLMLPDDDVADLKNCRVGACELKLSQDALERMRRTLDWSKPTVKRDADALARQLALDYVAGYIEGGNDRLAVYRDGARPTFAATEFRSMIERMPELGGYLPDLKAYLLGYPKVPLPNSTSFLYWQEAKFGLKPTIRISHLVIEERPDSVAVANKLIYASHYFWTALELRVLVFDAARGRGFWFVNVNRSRSDGLDGFVGRIIRGRVQSEAQKSLENALTAAKATIEKRSGEDAGKSLRR